MKIINFGSINIDYVYDVNHIVRAGETTESTHFSRFAGGKGLNQSVAIAKAGASVFHAGMIGNEGVFLKQFLEAQKVDTTFVKILDDQASGHAIIQVDETGQNSIILFGGANWKFDKKYIDEVLNQFDEGDILILQNEINAIPHVLEKAKSRGLKVFFNPAPMNREVLNYPLGCVDCFIVNEIEGSELTGETEPERIISAIVNRYPEASVILTLGENGSMYADSQRILKVAAEKVDVVDTTAAGDTFIGYFISEFVKRSDIDVCLKTATKAAAWCVTRRGAADSIPKRSELNEGDI
jgi:ribokinase